MKIYHGSKRIIDNPVDHGSKEDNDYGAAFYLTLDLESAHEWACRNNSVGFVNEYELDTKGLKILDLTDSSKYSVLHHLAILLHYRYLDEGFIKAFKHRLDKLEELYYIDISKYDLVIGYRADDAYFRFPLDFVRGNLTLEQLEQSYRLGSLGIQYVLISKKAFNHLTYISSFISNEQYILKYYEKVKSATEEFNLLNKDEDGTRILDILKD